MWNNQRRHLYWNSILKGKREITVVNIQKFEEDTDIIKVNDYEIATGLFFRFVEFMWIMYQCILVYLCHFN